MDGEQKREHDYSGPMQAGMPMRDKPAESRRRHSWIRWQSSPVRVVGVEGEQPEDVLLVVRDRLAELNAELPSRETSLAITHIEEATHWLEARRQDREARGVEGTHRP